MISVIVPVYNVEKYLPRCVDSILAQSLDDFELLLIDDGSTDQSGRICDEYAGRDARVRVFHNVNGGVSEARNCGIDNIRGDYFCFVDSDDYIGRDYLKLMGEMTVEDHADLSIISSVVVFGEDREFAASHDKRHVMDAGNAFREMLLGFKFGWAPYGKLYSRRLFQNMRFPRGYVYDDFCTIPYIFEKCERIVYSEAVQYYYFQREQSLTHVISAERMLMWEKGMEKLMRYVETVWPQYMPEGRAKLINGLFRENIDQLLYSGDYPAVADRAKEKWGGYIKNPWNIPYIGWKQKMSVTFFLISPKLYRTIKKGWFRHRRETADGMNRKLMDIQ